MGLQQRKIVGNKAKERISKWVFQESKARQNLRTTNISYPLIRTRFEIPLFALLPKKYAKPFFMQSLKACYVRKHNGHARKFFNIILYEERKKQIIKSKVKGDVDHVTQYFLKKYLHAMTKMTKVLRNLEPNIL